MFILALGSRQLELLWIYAKKVLLLLHFGGPYRSSEVVAQGPRGKWKTRDDWSFDSGICYVWSVWGTEKIADPMSHNAAVNTDWDKLDDKEKKILDER